MAWEVVIGLETHVQLSTHSKIFSGSSTAFGAAPNTQANVVDMALPGVLPVMNKGAVERAIKLGLAVGGNIAAVSQFERKNYFYPDLPKAYQISQFEVPVVAGGGLTILKEDGTEKFIRLTRAHLEEDAGKSLHEDFAGMSGIDLNRCGTPLLEVVTEPDMASAKEAVAYAKALHGLVTWIGICDGNMQEGSFRCDANVSVRRTGEPLGTRCEIKNLNSFRFMEDAINYEVRRQIELIEDGGKVVQETRLYDPDRGETRSMRSKEDAHDYRYFPDPDLPPLSIDAAWIERTKSEMPELPGAMKERFEIKYGLSPYDASTITQAKDVANYFEAVVICGADPKVAANWVSNQVLSSLNRLGVSVSQFYVTAEQLARMIKHIADGTVNANTARTKIFDELSSRQGMFAAMWSKEHPEAQADVVDRIIESQGLKQISDTGEIEKIIDEVLAANAKSVEEFKAGKEKAFNALVGQAMKATKGKANPATVNELLKKKLGA
ncbi:MAG: Asp-tRNA(Asn)/Glu-tRNA(Gln) amidotransferase subunit GatB [Burkholderiaceae bacterium]